MKKQILLMSAIIIAFTSCQKNNTPVPDKAPLSKLNVSGLQKLACTTPPPPCTTDVYVAGSIQAVNGKSIAVYWKNGVITKLTDSTSNASAIDITVKGTDVYVAGNIGLNAVYWKNGVAHTLTTNGTATAIVFGYYDFYVTGRSGATATVWKNGIPTSLLHAEVGSDATGVALNGSDVYVTGETRSSAGNEVATYWKNNVPVKIGDTILHTNTYARGITINAGNIYIAGGAFPNDPTLTEEAVFWKNGVMTDLGNASAEASHIGISGSNNYIVGGFTGAPDQGPFIMYWKNNTLVTPFLVNPDTFISYTGGIAVSGNDVYITASFGPAHIGPPGQVGTVGYFKNGVLTTLATVDPLSGYGVGNVFLAQH